MARSYQLDDPAIISFTPAPGGGGAAGGLVVRRPGDPVESLVALNGPALATSGVPFGTFGAWVGFDAGVAYDRYLNQIAARRRAMFNSIGGLGVEIGYSAVVGVGVTSLDFVRGMRYLIDPTTDDTGFPGMDHRTWLTKIPANQIPQVRVTEAGAAVADWDVLCTCFNNAIPTWANVQAAAPTGAGRYIPGNTAAATASPSAVWPVWGAWTQFLAAAANDMLVRHVSFGTAGADAQRNLFGVQIGIGALGAEVACATYVLGRGQAFSVIDPPVKVLTGERLVARTTYLAVGNIPIALKVIDL